MGLMLTFVGSSKGAGGGGCSALAKTDVFTGTTGVQLTAYSANWALSAGDFDIQNNGLASDSANEGAAYWSADSFYADQYAQCTVAAASNSTRWIGIAVRVSATSWYGFYYGAAAEKYLFKVVGGVRTVLATLDVAIEIGDTLLLTVVGTTLTILQNSVEITSVTDSAISSGAPGVCGVGDTASNRIDNWEGGNICP